VLAPTHLLITWLSTVEILKTRRERVLVTLAGVAPDLDGLGWFYDRLSHGATHFYLSYHHQLGHNLIAATLCALLVYILSAQQRLIASGCAFAAVHLHILCDLLGSRGADGYQWPIQYLYPFPINSALVWSGQWDINAWQNRFILFVALCGCGYYLCVRRMTFFEIFGLQVEAAVIGLFDKLVNWWKYRFL
jgi:inner membrane protein